MLEHRPRRRRLRGHAAVPLQRADGGLGAVDRGRCLGRPGPAVQRVGVAARRAPLRRHLVQLHGQAAVVPGGLARASRRRRQPVAGGLRQRGRAPGARSVRHALRGARSSTPSARPRAASPSSATSAARPGAMGVAGADHPGRGRGRTTSARWPRFDPDGAPDQRGRRAWARSSTRPAAAPSRATTTTPRPPRRPPARAGTGRATWATWTSDRYLFFAGRTAEWIRVDGENFPAGPIADAVGLHPDVVVAVAYGVPDPEAGDQVMVALVLAPGADLRPGGLRRLDRRRRRPRAQVATPLGPGGRPSCPPPAPTRS